MKRITPEIKELLDKSIKSAINGTHMIDLIIWDIIKPHKRDAFFQYLIDGMSWEFAYRKAKATIKHKPNENKIH